MFWVINLLPEWPAHSSKIPITRTKQDEATKLPKDQEGIKALLSTQTSSAPPLPVAPAQVDQHPVASTDILNLISCDTTTISEEGKTIVSSTVKAMQVIVNQKDQTISQMQNQIYQPENSVIQLENQIDDVNQYERRYHYC